MTDQSFKYNDIIDLPHHISKTRHRMSLYDRAAQFSPFAALVGYEDAVRETARKTSEKIELDEAELSILDTKLHILKTEIKNAPTVSITYFVADAKKAGGKYISLNGSVKRIDEYERTILFTDGTTIPMDDITSIDGDIFFVLDKDDFFEY